MTTETDLLPLPELPRQVEGYNSDYWEAGQIEEYAADYARANVEHHIAPLQAEIEALRAEVERLNRILGRIVEGDGDSTTKILFGTDAFAAAREYLLRDQEEGK
jgi:hypothetical protein